MAIEILRPNAAGDYTNLPVPKAGDHWDAVNDILPDNLTRVGNDEELQLKDAYNLQNTAIPIGSVINSVKVYFRVKASEPNYTCYAQPFLRLDGSETDGTPVEHTTDTWATYSEVLVRPGGGSWEVSDLDDLQVVIGLTISEAPLDAYCTQIYVEIDYTLRNINTAEKRKSISGIIIPLMPGVTPNASKDSEWRQQSGWSYSGIATTPSVGVPTHFIYYQRMRRA